MHLLVVASTLALAVLVTALLSFLIFAGVAFCEDRLRGAGGGAIDSRYRSSIALAALGLVALALAVGMVLGRYSAGSSAGAGTPVQRISDAVVTTAPSTTEPAGRGPGASSPAPSRTTHAPLASTR